MIDDMMIQYAESIKSFERTISDKEATVRMLMGKYQPEGLWDHGEELLSVEREVDFLKAKLYASKRNLRMRREAMCEKAKVDDSPRLF